MNAAAPSPAPLAGLASGSAIDRAERWLLRGEMAVSVAALAVIMATVAISVAARALLLPIPNLTEWAVTAMSALTFLGASACTALRRHINIEVVDLLPAGALRFAAHLASLLAQLVFGVMFAITAWGFFDYALDSGEKLIDLGTPVALPSGLMVAGAALIALHAALAIYRLVAGRPALEFAQ
ncbi:TRAP transporter small permease [Bordetella parapertussis]|uniref:TRAP transporter small permease protein n=5 Tax=Bordetella TaxID=517 RepID=A0A0H3LPX6_BORBR|nr:MULTISPECIES: TRAP transporter small permease subunit [Bordetella]KAK62836.1 TRAP transporter, DctQ-like membrane protein [Bordetella bronchiseptica 980-2]SHQ95619.1 TRAP-type C4-dicarboxylate transport system, small permease component [Mycobacteroides abscessus subsp. abscessus]AMG89991.1 TRAP transporter small permease [Bordetella bronchiseptica]AOB40466.1 C4-dicarboxylate ABC transporter permease [Bordetella parapertussis]AUL44491.1 C4-dicarboxylate ABC transporter permease [Bordetella p